MSESDSQVENEALAANIDFGSILSGARRAKNYSVEEISEFLKIPAQTISALESSNIERLPAPTFTQGYIRTYAKFLEISEDTVLDRYNQAVPHQQASDLKPRSNLPDEASSQSPVVKSITLLLIFAGIAALVFGSFQYYQEKADDIESSLENKPDSFTGNSLDSPGESLVIKQQTQLDEESGELVTDKTDAASGSTALFEQEETTSGMVVADGQVKYNTDSNNSIVTSDEVDPADNAEADTKSDIIEIHADKGSWLEVQDANNTRLFYNMLKTGASKVLVGRAPFRITMGNARTTRVKVNNLDVDVTSYISSKNTAIFSVSTEDGNIVFH